MYHIKERNVNGMVVFQTFLSKRCIINMNIVATATVIKLVMMY